MSHIKNAVSVSITLTQNVNDYTLINSQVLENRAIKGFFVRKAGGKNIAGASLCNATAIGSGFLTIQKDGINLLQNYPLQHSQFDIAKDAIGDYVPVSWEEGIDVGTSKVYFSSASDIVTGEVLEIVFIVEPLSVCK